MTATPDLTPVDGLTDSNVEFAGLDVLVRGAAVLRFNITGEDGALIGTFRIPVAPQPDLTIDAMIVDGHRQMRDVLRTWLFRVERLRRIYAKETGSDLPTA